MLLHYVIAVLWPWTMIIFNNIFNLIVVALNGNQRQWPKDSRLCWRKSLLVKEPLKQNNPSYQVSDVLLIFRFLKIVVDIFISFFSLLKISKTTKFNNHCKKNKKQTKTKKSYPTPGHKKCKWMFITDCRSQTLIGNEIVESTYALPEKTKRGPPTNRNISVRNMKAQITNMSLNENAGFKSEYHVRVFNWFYLVCYHCLAKLFFLSR